MGSMFSRSEVVVRGSYTYPVSAAVVEGILRDIGGIPSFVPELLSLEFLEGDSCTVGASWIERRIFAGKEILIRKTITRVSENPFTVNTYVDHPRTDHCCAPKGEGTFTVVIEPGHKEGVCVNNWTMAMVTSGIFGKLMLLLCTPYLKKALREMVHKDNEQYAAEAVRRERLIAKSGDAEME